MRCQILKVYINLSESQTPTICTKKNAEQYWKYFFCAVWVFKLGSVAHLPVHHSIRVWQQKKQKKNEKKLCYTLN